MLVADILRAVVLRWRLVAGIFAAVLAFTLIWIVLTPHEYRATATLLFDNRAPDPAGSDKGGAGTSLSQRLATEAQILRSDVLARRVAAKLGLTDDESLRQQWKSSTDGSQSFEGWLAARLRTGLEVVPSTTGNTIEISYQSRNPEQAAHYANSFATAFNDTRLAMSTDLARRYAQWSEQRIGESRKRLEQTQKALSDFQRRRGIIATGSIDAESIRLSELTAKLSTAEATAADAQARAAHGASMPEVQASAVVQGLQAQIAAKSATIQQMGTELGPRNARMLAARAELAELQAKLAAATGTSAGSLSAASSAASASRAATQALHDRQRARMLALAADRGQLQVLESNVASARREYDTISEQLTEMRAKSTLPALNVVRLNNAEPPLLPNAPNIALRLVLMTLFGAMLAVAAAIFAEWLHPRIRSREGVAYITGAVPLGHADFRLIRQQLLIEGGPTS